MRHAIHLFGLALLMALGPTAQAQNYVFSYISCTPSSCVDEGAPAETETATVVFLSDCTGGAVGGLNLQAVSQIQNCQALYIPYASATTSQTEYYNDDTCTVYDIDYVTMTTEVFTAAGSVDFYADQTYGCDGSQTGVTTVGTKPC